MKLHLNERLFRQAIQITADQMNIPAIYVEKDYWVTLVLYTIFQNEIGNDSVFKGGTALSKCYQAIERFSEDIDLVVLRREGESNNQLSNKLKKISNTVAKVLPEVHVSGLTQKMGMNRKTAHTYVKVFGGSYGQVRDVIVVEATWLGYFDPFTTRSINSFVGEMMIRSGQDAIAEEHNLQPFELNVLEPIRTICEKIMSLVRFSYTESPLIDLRNKIRHVYDLHMLLQIEEFSDFFNSTLFDELIIKVAHDDVASYKNSNEWLVHHPNDAMIFNDLDNIWAELNSVYTGDFRNMVYGTLPEPSDVLITLKRIKARLAEIIWTIQI